MSDSISRKVAQRLFTKALTFKERTGKLSWTTAEMKQYVVDFVEDLPSAEPQITHCKDCRWWTNQSTTLQGKCKLHGLNPMPEWYCASGEVSK